MALARFGRQAASLRRRSKAERRRRAAPALSPRAPPRKNRARPCANARRSGGMTAKRAKKRQKKTAQPARSRDLLAQRNVFEGVKKWAFRFAPPLSSPGDQEEKKRKARKRRGYPETPWNHGAGANGFPCCESSKKRNPDASSGAWRFSLDCWPSWRRDADERRPGAAPAFQKKTPRPKSRGVFFRQRSCKDRRIRVQEAAARRAAKPRTRGGAAAGVEAFIFFA